jgi:hypothetical protein
LRGNGPSPTHIANFTAGQQPGEGSQGACLSAEQALSAGHGLGLQAKEDVIVGAAA